MCYENNIPCKNIVPNHVYREKLKEGLAVGLIWKENCEYQMIEEPARLLKN